MKAVFVCIRNETILNRVYREVTQKALAKRADFFAPVTGVDELESRKTELAEAEFIFSTWGMPALSEKQIGDYFPNVKAVFYAAGSVQYFAAPFLARGVRIFSAAEANAVPVIEYTAAEIILANKGFFGSSRLYSGGNRGEAGKYASAFPGNFGTAVGIIGAGKIGSGVIRRLKEYQLEILVFDPFLKSSAAEALGVKKLDTLEELFSASFVISNHLADKDETAGMLRYHHFSLMDDHGVFINTARGRQVVEEDLARALGEKPGRTALLDVSFPEPVPPGHPFYSLDNVILTPHIAGSSGNEVGRMGDFITGEFVRFLEGRPLRAEVTADMLAVMA
ncbi:2-hydroxyacid dehydrogenase [Spirochaetia bacterium]|nr:2-hydroxyacid dehydrogenase [Spirochaetia bacterium]